MVPILQTSRLILQPLQLADAGQIQRLFAQWEIVQFLNARVPWPFPEDGALTNLRDHSLPAMEAGEAWDWTLRLRSSPEEIIGRIGLYKGGDNNRGFWIGVPWQGKGLMTEAVVAVTDFWFEQLGFDVLRAPKAVANTASRRISENLGMRVIETRESDYVCGRLPTELWEITADEWRAWQKKNLAAIQAMTK